VRADQVSLSQPTSQIEKQCSPVRVNLLFVPIQLYSPNPFLGLFNGNKTIPYEVGVLDCVHTSVWGCCAICRPHLASQENIRLTSLFSSKTNKTKTSKEFADDYWADYWARLHGASSTAIVRCAFPSRLCQQTFKGLHKGCI
jgi:hypothetical protein